jgi:hypothetical protein
MRHCRRVVINTMPLIAMNETAHLPLRKVPNDFFGQ